MSVDKSDYKFVNALEALLADPVQAFAVFARFKNFTHAAEELGISMPSLHSKINKLQDRIGSELYVKNGKQLTLTSSGEELVRYSEESRRNAVETLTRLLGDQSRPMMVAAGRGALMWVISDAMERLSQRGGGVKVVTAQNDEALSLIQKGDVDVAVIAHDPPPKKFQRFVLNDYTQMLIVQKSHRLAERTSVRVEDLDGLQFVLPERGTQMRDSLIRKFRSAQVDLKVEAEALDWELLVRFVSYGTEATIVNEFIPVPQNLVKIPVVDLPLATYYTIWRETRQDLAEEFNCVFEECRTT